MPAWLGRARRSQDPGIYQPRKLDAEKARFILQRRLQGAQRQLRRVAPRAQSSDWAEYAQRHSYTDAQLLEKQSMMERVLSETLPLRVLDVGCNTGQFSLLAARAGAEVVAIDVDPVSVGHAWDAAREARANVLPLVVNLARPTPAMGWRKRESPSFLVRARGNFDCVVMLAVLHHLLVSERVPLDEVLALAAELTRDLLVIEFVGPEDAMFRLIARGRDHLHAGLNPEAFEKSAARWFEKVAMQPIAGSHRRMYVLRRKRS
jgi:SAM-dependent methyltransferase